MINNNNKTLLNLKDVNFTYETSDTPVVALKDINIDINSNEFICVLGPSGCGKSTLLKIIAGYMKPTSGEARLNGKLIEEADEHRGVMFQSPTLYPWLSVRENIEFGPKMLGMDKSIRKDISDSLLKEIEIESFASNSTFELSGGMKQRVALARVLANQPEIILMDEPFGALDALTRLKMHRLVRRIWNERKNTVFLITHDIDEALCLATRIIVMTPSPGTIEKEIDLNFTYEALNDEKGRVNINEDYLKIKEQILDLID